MVVGDVICAAICRWQHSGGIGLFWWPDSIYPDVSSNWLVEKETGAMAAHEGDPESIKKRIEQIRKRGTSPREIDALRCTDDTWQSCILAALEEVDLVIIDNVDCSENIDWEIQQSIEKVGSDRVLMLLRPDASTEKKVTPLHFDFDGAKAEIDALRDTWGADDFGESESLGVSGQQLAEL